MTANEPNLRRQPDPSPGLEVADYPVTYQASDSSSVAGQREYRRLVAAELAAVVLGSLVGAAGGWLGVPATVAGGAAAVAFLTAIVARLVRERRGDDGRWFDGRAIAETAKSQTWRYVMRVPPFDDDATADRRLVDELKTALRARESFTLPMRLPASHSQITARMREIRRLPMVDRRDVYVGGRLLDQAEWYRRSALRHQATGQRWSWASLASEGLAVVAAVLALQLPGFGQFGLIGVFGASAAAFATWAQVGGHGEAAKAYGLAYQELLMVSSLADDVQQEVDLSRLVRDGENAISREHTMWIAKRSDLATADQIETLHRESIEAHGKTQATGSET